MEEGQDREEREEDAYPRMLVGRREARADEPETSRFLPATGPDADQQIIEEVVDKLWVLIRKLEKPPRPVTLDKLSYIVSKPKEWADNAKDPTIPTRHTYSTRDGLVPFNRVMGADGKLRVLRSSPAARLKRIIMSLDRDGEWHRIKATHGITSKKERARSRCTLYNWLWRLGYQTEEVRINWNIKGLAVKWEKSS